MVDENIFYTWICLKLRYPEKKICFFHGWPYHHFPHENSHATVPPCFDKAVWTELSLVAQIEREVLAVLDRFLLGLNRFKDIGILSNVDHNYCNIGIYHAIIGMSHPFQLFSIHHMREYCKAWYQGQAAESCPCPTEHANSELAVCFYSLCHPRRCLVLARRGSISDYLRLGIVGFTWLWKTSCLADWLCC